MNIEQSVSDYVVENFLFGAGAALGPTQSLLKTGVVDSTGVMELVLFLEETYQVEIGDEEMLPENLDSIRNIARFVERKLAARLTATQPAAR